MTKTIIIVIISNDDITNDDITKDDITMNKIIAKISPLTETTFYILVSLVEPLHGYGIMQKVKQLSNGRLKLGPGTLYGVLSNLLALGLIASVDSGGESERRKIYRMTSVGREVAEFELARLEEMSRNGRSMLGMGVKK